MLVLLLASPALCADDKPKNEAKSPQEQYAALLKDFNAQQRDLIAQCKKPRAKNSGSCCQSTTA